MLNIVIFSKNRAAQLELLLRSMRKFYQEGIKHRPTVLYKADPEYVSAYNLLIEEYPDVDFVLETNFHDQVIELVNKPARCVQFFVDDQVFIREFTLSCPEFTTFLQNQKEFACLSLRLGMNITYCYSMNSKMRTPQMLGGKHIYRWRGLGGDWGYPMSVDGNIFFTEDILGVLNTINFYHPNSLEGGMAHNPIQKELSIVMPETVVINIPANKVQVDYSNRSMNVSPEFINQQFLANKRICLSSMANIKPESVHLEADYVFVDKEAVND